MRENREDTIANIKEFRSEIITDSTKVKSIRECYDIFMPINLPTSMQWINFFKDTNYQSLFKKKNR